MNKKFYFALALTVGLFASCSSDDLTAEAPQQQGFEVNDNEPAQIKISTGMATRGTGSVGFPTAQWDGQTFNLFMFAKGTFNPAMYKATENDPETPIYLNTEMTTDPNTQTANYVLNGETQYNYFPGNGAFSFWAYRIDDALDPAPATLPAQPFVYVDDNNAEVAADAATKVVVPVDIDGSQDIMVAIARTDLALTELQTKVPTATEDRIYTAYSARRNVNPKLQFNHLLTRLSFKVIADSREVSNAADWIIADPAARAASGETFKGFKITQVRVKTKSKGHVVAAFKDLSRVAEPRLVFDDDQEWADYAVGEDDPTVPSKLKSVYLQTRDVTVLPADYKMQAIDPSYAGADVTVANAGYEYAGFSGATTFALDGAMKCYTYPAGTAAADMVDAKGMPNGAETTIAEAVAAGTALVYLPTYKSGTRTEDGTAYNQPSESFDASADLRPFNLDTDDLIPHWNNYFAPQGGNPEWHLMDAADVYVTGYNWVASDATEYAAAGVTEDINYPDPAPDANTAGADGKVVKYRNADYTYTYYKMNNRIWSVAGAENYLTEYAAAGAAVDPVTDALAVGVENQIVWVGGGGDPENAATQFYKYYAVGAAGNGGQAEATSIGEALLVAPADATGYFVEFTYTRFKKITATHVEPMTNTATIQVTSGQGFEAGKHYVITARLFKDGDIVIGGVDENGDSNIPTNPWGNGTGNGQGGTDQDEWDLE